MAQFYVVAAVGAGSIVGGAIAGAVHFIKRQSPLVKSELHAWAKDHSLEVDKSVYSNASSLLNNFPIGSKIMLCISMMQSGSCEYEHWFISNGAWHLEFGNGDDLTNNMVTVHMNQKAGYRIFKKLRVDQQMVERMHEVLGASNYSLLLRNCEHIANYVAFGRWVSIQTVREGRIGRALLEFVCDKEHLALRNLLPKELRKSRCSEGERLFNGKQGRIAYQQTRLLLNANDRDAFNIVFLGPTGAGKSSLINLLFNKRVAETSDDVDSDVMSCTRNMQFYCGQGECVASDHKGNHQRLFRRVNIIDTIGFCDSEMSASEVYRLTKEQIEGNCMKLHRVVICTAGRIEHHHADAIKQFLKWLHYDNDPNTEEVDPVIFVYTKCDASSRDSPERRERNKADMMDRLGALAVFTEIPARTPFNPSNDPKVRQVNLAVGFPPDSDCLESQDYKDLCDILFDTPMKHFDITRSWCSIL